MSKFVNGFKVGVRKFMDIIYPEDLKCFGCNQDLKVKNFYNICDKCKPNFRFNSGKGCNKCGGSVFGDSLYCPRCKNAVRYFERARAPLEYSGIVQKIIRRFKYDGDKFYGRYFAKILAEEFAKSEFEVDVVVPVPMTKNRMKERGYNHAKVIAQEFCKIVGLPLDVDNLVRVHNTESQTRKSASERYRNLTGAFQLTKRGAFTDKNVLLIDDVMTTGATASECAKVLKANKVYVLTVAHSKLRISALSSPQSVKNKVFIRKKTLA